jgi:hypothetical protein
MRGKITLRSLVGLIILGSLGTVGFFVWQALAPSGDKHPPAKSDVAADLKLDRFTTRRRGTG